MQLKQLLDTEVPISTLLDQNCPFALAYKLSTLIDTIQKHRKFYDTSLQKIADDFGQRDDNNNLIQDENGGVKIKPDKIDECNQKILELDSVEISDELPELTPEELNSFTISPRMAFLLRPLFSK